MIHWDLKNNRFHRLISSVALILLGLALFWLNFSDNGAGFSWFSYPMLMAVLALIVGIGFLLATLRMPGGTP